MHTQIRQATGRKQSACVTTYIEDKDDNIIMEQDTILARWHEYIIELYDNNTGDIPQVHTDSEITPDTRREVEFALKAGLTELIRLTNMIYQEGCFPEKINNSIFITLPKVSGTAKM